MNARVFANTSTLSLTTTLDGGAFVPPVIPAYSEIYLRYQLAEDIQDSTILDTRGVHSAAARIGWRNAAPTQGTYQLTVTYSATPAETAAISYDATASEIASAINAALTTAGLTALEPCTVTSYLDGFRIVFEDNTVQPVITCTDNALWPMSFVDVDEIAFDAGYAYVLQLRQAPVAETSVTTSVAQSIPTITSLQTGSTTDGVAINAIQKLYIPPTFSGGSFQILRGGVKTEPIAVPVESISLLASRLEKLADTDGSFVVTQVANGAYIEFAEGMGGEAQDLMTIEVFEAPAPDQLIRLDTRTDAMRTLMRGADTDGQISVPFNLRLEVEDGVTSGQYQVVNFDLELTFVQPVSDDSHNVAASLVWNQPLSRADNIHYSTDSLLIGNRAVSKVIGNGSSTSFPINHNLVENAQTFTVNSTTDIFTAASHNYQDGDPVLVSSSGTLPDPLADTTTYFVISATTDTFQLSTTIGGSAVNLTDTGSGTHTATLKDGTLNAVSVEVWETGGDKARISPSDYTVERTSANAVTVSGFASTPTSGQYEVLIQTYGRPATYQAHTHPDLDDTPEAKSRIEAIETRLDALEALAPSDLRLSLATTTGSYRREATIPNFSEVFPAQTRSGIFRIAEQSRFATFDLATLGRGQGRLFGAVHVSSLTSLDTIDVQVDGVATLPTASASHTGKVYENDTGDIVIVPAGGGHPSATLAADETVASDGEYWYKVVQYGATSETSFYPVGFERTLFAQGISGEDLISNRKMEIVFDFEVGMLDDAESSMVTYLVFEVGTWIGDSTPSTTGGNLQNIAWTAAAAHSERILITSMADRYQVGYRVVRDGDTLTASALTYGTWKSATAPAATDFAIRARLIRWDTENAADTPKGRVFLSGPTFDDSGTSTGKMIIS